MSSRKNKYDLSKVNEVLDGVLDGVLNDRMSPKKAGLVLNAVRCKVSIFNVALRAQKGGPIAKMLN